MPATDQIGAEDQVGVLVSNLKVGDPVPVPPEPASEAEITREWVGATPVVSIACHTYQHAAFIRDALNGMLAQRTDFPFEIIVHDDASTDGAADIIRSYAAAYPNIIRSVLQPQNIYSKGLRPPFVTFPMARGKYIAMCEGDDYWLDENKLAKQVRFLEANPDFSVCCHDALVMSDCRLVRRSGTRADLKRELSREELLRPPQRKKLGGGGIPVQTVTAVFRNVLLEIPPELGRARNVDAFLFSTLGRFGKSKYLDSVIPAVYRLHGGGVWSSSDSKDKLVMRVNTFYWMGEYYARIGDQRTADFYFHLAAQLLTSRAESGHLAEVTGILYRHAKRRMSEVSPVVFNVLRRLKRGR